MLNTFLWGFLVPGPLTQDSMLCAQTSVSDLGATAVGQVPSVALMGHENAVLSVAFSPAGDRLASSSADETIRVWSIRKPTDAPLILKGHKGSVTSVAFSPMGEKLISGGTDRTIRIWDVWNVKQLGTQLFILNEHTDTVSSVAANRDALEPKFASGSSDHTVRVWDLNQPKSQPLVFQYKSRITGDLDYPTVALSRRGAILAAGTNRSMVLIWGSKRPDEQPDPLITGLLSDENTISALSFSPDGYSLAAATRTKGTYVWNLRKPQQPIVFPTHSGTLSVSWSRDGQRLATGGTDALIRIWGIRDNTASPIVLKGHSRTVTSVAFSPTGERLASASSDNAVRIWDLEALKPAGSPSATSAPLTTK